MNIISNLNLFLCLIESKRKLRRSGKLSLQIPLQSKIKRILEFLNTGKLIDYTHTSEIDEIFKYIYKSYEMLLYLEKELKYLMFSKSNIDYFIYSLDKFSKKELLKTYFMIYILRKQFELYITNFLNLIIAIVYKNKFYGWNLYKNDLVTEMFISTFENIKTLRFNPDKSKASVYIYQTAWLKGLYTSKEILNNLKKTIYIKPTFDREDRGNIIFSDNFNENETYIDNYISFNNLENTNETDINTYKYESDINIDEIFYNYYEYENKEELLENINNILKERYNITLEDLQYLSDNKIKKLGKELRNILFNK